MSRVAKKPVAITKGVELDVQPESISVKGPKGTLSVPKPAGIEVKIEDGNAQLSANDPSLVPLTGLALTTQVPVVNQGLTTGQIVALSSTQVAAIETGDIAVLTLNNPPVNGLGYATRVAVAEGIENEAVARLLIEMGCDTGQGFLYSKARTMDDLLRSLHERSLAA